MHYMLSMYVVQVPNEYGTRFFPVLHIASLHRIKNLSYIFHKIALTDSNTSLSNVTTVSIETSMITEALASFCEYLSA